jgi:hypothetical protein
VKRRSELLLFGVVVALLLATHMLRFGQAGRPLLLGWMPIDFAFRLAWMAAAMATVFWMTARLWPDRE